MSRMLPALMCAAIGLCCQTNETGGRESTDRPALEQILSFEGDHQGSLPGGWDSHPAGAVVVDGEIVRNGRWSARIQSDAADPGSFSVISKAIPLDFAGKTIELSGYLRTEDVIGYTGLWIAGEWSSRTAVLENVESRQLKGTTPWARHSTSSPLRPGGKRIEFGVILSGAGKVWVDDLQLHVDGKPVWDAPKAARIKTALELDHEFDTGSGIALSDLTKLQIENLALLGKVWGFLKYHHPRITSGRLHWDYELFRILPVILAAGSRPAANAALHEWIGGLGEVKACDSCAKLDESDIHLRPKLDWIADEGRLGASLSRSLRQIHRNRTSDGQQFYVSLAPGVGNPVFEHEPAYAHLDFPDSGFQLLAVYRFWNIIEYWSPYRDLVGANWDDVLTKFIPRVSLAASGDAYRLELMALAAMVRDTHTNLWSLLRLRPPVGDCQLPVTVRFIDSSAVVSGYSDSEAGPATGLKVGDVITELDGSPVAGLVERLAPYYAASNRPTLLRDMARSITRGVCEETTVRVRRKNEVLELRADRQPLAGLNLDSGRTHDLPGDTFRLLSDEVAYLKLSSVKQSETARYIEAASGTKGLIIDIRGYPKEFVVFALGMLLVEKETEFARFTNGDLSNPGAFHWTKPITLTPKQPHYSGKVVILVDENSLSQAEYTSMAFRSAPQAIVVGSTTAGADGNVSSFGLPGGVRTLISGIGVFYPDKSPTQRIGIVPDVEARPTIVGIRAGKDEVLEEALRQILGPDIPVAEIEKLLQQ